MKHLMFIAIAMFSIMGSLIAQQQNTEKFVAPIDGIVEKTLAKERRVLPYQPIREADIFWEKRVWRVIDTREKMNQVFRYPKRMLFDIIVDNIQEGEIQAYGINDNDDFTQPLSKEEVEQYLFDVDTIVTFDPITYKETIEIVYNDINADNIKRFRVKEIWYFDENTSTMNVRITGIAPLQDVYDNMENFLYELPMFWVYFPQTRESLARELVFNPGNDNAPMSWLDVFEMRQFASHIYKESNVMDRQIQHYATGLDRMFESEKINSEIFNFEHDLWEF
ncbi:MAG: gliding motility associated protein GldN [Maribacter sp.]|jgi:gliding motility associated protien GldN